MLRNMETVTTNYLLRECEVRLDVSSCVLQCTQYCLQALNIFIFCFTNKKSATF